MNRVLPRLREAEAEFEKKHQRRRAELEDVNKRLDQIPPMEME